MADNSDNEHLLQEEGTEDDCGNDHVEELHPMEMLDSVFERYFSYGQEGAELNVVDALLLIKEAIDNNSKCLLKLAAKH